MNAPDAVRPKPSGGGGSAAEPSKTHVVREFAHKSPLIGCRFDPSGRYVFAGAEDTTVIRWDLTTGAAVPFQSHESWVFALAFDPEGRTLLTGGGDGRIAWWPATAEKAKARRTIEAHRGWVRALAVSPDGSTLASCGNDRIVRLWSLATGTPLMELPGHEKPVFRLVFTPDGRTLISADLRGNVIAWDHRPGKEGRRLDAGQLCSYNAAGQEVDYGGVRDLTLSHDGKFLACGGLIEATNPLGAVNTPAVVVFDWVGGKIVRVLRPKGDLKGVISGLRYHPTGFLLASVHSNTGQGHLLFWKTDAPTEFFRLDLPSPSRGIDLHPDGLRIASTHHDGKLRISLMRPKSA